MSKDLENLPEGLVKILERDRIKLLKGAFFVPRFEAESNESWRQVIPYVMILDGQKILLVKRTKCQTEERLHGLYSIGIGGHVNDTDGNNPVEAFNKGLHREISEEVHVDLKSLKFIGLINDLSTEVSRVHVGFLYVANAKIFGVREENNFEWHLVKVSDLEKFEEGMENWSRIAMKWLKSNHLQN